MLHAIPDMISLLWHYLLTLLYSRFTISAGSFQVTVPQRGAIAIHTGSQSAGGQGSGTGDGSVTVNFAETATTVWGEVCPTIGDEVEVVMWAHFPSEYIPRREHPGPGELGSLFSGILLSYEEYILDLTDHYSLQDRPFLRRLPCLDADYPSSC